MLFGLLVIPVFLAVGASVDIGRVLYIEGRMQSSLDSAVLAGGREYQVTGDAASAETMLNNFFVHRFTSGKGLDGHPAIKTAKVDHAKYKILAIAEAVVPTPFIGIVGNKTMTVRTRSESSLAIGGGNSDKDIEVSLMLDITGSMNTSSGPGGSRLSEAKRAAKDLVDILMPSGFAGETHTRIALVPFSQYVNVGSTYYKAVTGFDPPSASRTCVTERTGTDKATDAKPGTGSWIGAFTPSSNHSSLDCEPNAEIMPLSQDRNALVTAIDGFSANGWTAGHLGTAWAWYTLSHKWTSVWPTASHPAAPSSKVRKVAVLMTDGDYNTYYHNGEASQTQALALCNGMKGDGILVYTIGFGNDMSASTKTFLKNCASAADTYFDAKDGEELNQAFRTIAYSLSDLRLTQ
jgi:Flp pilus assembly protein TadG